jgi:hypothetical protein
MAAAWQAKRRMAIIKAFALGLIDPIPEYTP